MAILEESTDVEIMETHKASAAQPGSYLTVQQSVPSRESSILAASSHSCTSLLEGTGLRLATQGNAWIGTGCEFSGFVECKFIPEYVATKKAAGRAHFRAVLKHLLPPESVDAAFAVGTHKMAGRSKLFRNGRI